MAASSERFDHDYTDTELDELTRSIDGIADKAFDAVVLLNVNHHERGVRAAQALERRQRQRQIMEQMR